MRKTAIIVTTIFEPRFLEGYLANIRQFGRNGETELIVIPDRKTPASVGEACHAAVGEGFAVSCPDVPEQDRFLERLGIPPDFVPYDSDNRRNIGFLMALERGAEVFVSIDDDNFCPESVDFVAAHGTAGTEVAAEVRESSDGWLNICEELAFGETEAVPYPRGFPYAARRSTREVSREQRTVRVAVNAGLWTDDPDVDAVTRLALRPIATSWTGTPFVLGHGTCSPVNTQNTAISRAAMAAYWYARMGHPVAGMKIDRYGDILSGYLVQACARHLGESVRFGDPVCRHLRTPHDLFKDLYHELAGMVMIEALVGWLREVRLSGTTYLDAYASLAEALDADADRFRGFVWDDGGRDFLRLTAGRMRTWLAAVRRLG